ncbi:MAG: hypothetical protein AB1429_07010 [Pseudomonadota bacterium]|jgi:hypothetical protein
MANLLKSKTFQSTLIAGAALLGLAITGSAHAATAFAGVAPPTHLGACPFTFKFEGIISSPTPAVVKYRWIRSDGAIAPVQTVAFERAGRIPVFDTWTIGRSYVGWEALQLYTPNGFVSNKAVFKLRCVNPLTGGVQ